MLSRKGDLKRHAKIHLSDDEYVFVFFFFLVVVGVYILWPDVYFASKLPCTIDGCNLRYKTWQKSNPETHIRKQYIVFFKLTIYYSSIDDVSFFLPYLLSSGQRTINQKMSYPYESYVGLKPIHQVPPTRSLFSSLNFLSPIPSRRHRLQLLPPHDLRLQLLHLHLRFNVRLHFHFHPILPHIHLEKAKYHHSPPLPHHLSIGNQLKLKDLLQPFCPCFSPLSMLEI